MNYPLWATPARQTLLVRLWAKLGNKCLQGHSVCPNPEHYVYLSPKRVLRGKGVKVACKDSEGEARRDGEGNKIFIILWGTSKAVVHEEEEATLYDEIAEEAIAQWKALDRKGRAEAWKLEKRQLHPRFRLFRRGPWDTIRREEFLASRPIWSIEAIGVGAFTFQRVVKVEIPALKKVIWVNIPKPAGMSKNAKHKLIRYGKGKLPEELEDAMFRLVTEAVAKAMN